MLAWLTPDIETLTEGKTVRNICVSPSLLSFVGGALELLAENYNWEEFGTATPEEVADYFKQVRDDWGMSDFAEVGKIQAFINPTMPPKWLPLTGAAFPRANYPELEAVLPASWLIGSLIRPPIMALRSLIAGGTYMGNTYEVGDVGGVSLDFNPANPHRHTFDSGVPITVQAGVGAIASTPSGGSAFTSMSDDNGQSDNHPPFLAISWGIYAGR